MNKSNESYNVVEKCASLAKNKTFENIYSLICQYGDACAGMYLEEGERNTFTFNEQAERTDVWTLFLASYFPRKERVAISLDTCKEWFPLFWGLTRSGHDTLLLDPSFDDEKTARMMQEANCRYIVCAHQRTLPDGFRQLGINELRTLPDKLEPGRKCTPVWGHSVALCTSGTTSDSHVYVYKEESICEVALFSEKLFKENRLLIDNMPFRTLAFLPFHHVLGFAVVFIWSSFLGYTTVYLKNRAPQTILQTIRGCEVSQIVTVPLFTNHITKTFYATLANYNFAMRALIKSMISYSIFMQGLFPKHGHKMAKRMFYFMRRKMLGTHIKSLILGGSHADPVALRLMTAMGYYTVCGFGMTETVITSVETSWNLAHRLSGNIGSPMPYTYYRVKGGGNVGELQIKGISMHNGRFVKGELMPPLVDENGWFDSGDVIRINKATRQYIIEGRIKDVIIGESGENVYPDELEDTFSKIQGMTQFAIIGVPRKGSIYQDITLLVNVGDKMDDDAYTRYLAAETRRLNNTLPIFKRLRRLLITGTTLPAANGFKIKKQEVVKNIVAGKLDVRELSLSSVGESSPAPAATAAATVVATTTAPAEVPVTTAPAATPAENGNAEFIHKVRQVYADVLQIPLKEIQPDSHFVDELGGDSLQILLVVTTLEEKFGIIIPDEEYISCDTPAHTADMLHRLLHGGSVETRRREVRTPVTKFTDSAEYKAFLQRCDALLANGGENPYFVSRSSPLTDTCIIEGRKFIDFGNYNYAGMSGRREVSEAAKRAIDQYGTSASGSRLLAGEKPVHGELERTLAEWKNAEAALVFVGGHSTNVTFVGNFCGKDDLILYDALAHNSVIQGCKLSSAMTKSFPHNDFKTLEAMLLRDRKYFEKVLIVIEGVYSMDGDIAPVPEFVRIKKQYGCFLMVDEAHSACVLGPTGAGVDEYFHLASDDIDIKMGTLSKGLGTCGGYLAGKKELIEYLKYNLPGFVFSVGLSPALAAASLEAIRLLKKDPSIMQRMQANIEFFATEAQKRGLNICMGGKSAIVPILVGRDEDAFILSNAMRKRGVAVPPAVFPAVPKNKARLRFDVTSEHKPEQITYALDQLLEAAKELGIDLPPAEE